MYTHKYVFTCTWVTPTSFLSVTMHCTWVCKIYSSLNWDCSRQSSVNVYRAGKIPNLLWPSSILILHLRHLYNFVPFSHQLPPTSAHPLPSPQKLSCFWFLLKKKLCRFMLASNLHFFFSYLPNIIFFRFQIVLLTYPTKYSHQIY